MEKISPATSSQSITSVRERIREADFKVHAVLAEIVPLIKRIPRHKLKSVQEFLEQALEEAKKNAESTKIRAIGSEGKVLA